MGIKSIVIDQVVHVVMKKLSEVAARSSISCFVGATTKVDFFKPGSDSQTFLSASNFSTLESWWKIEFSMLFNQVKIYKYLSTFLLEFSKIVLFLVDLIGELMSLMYEEIDFLLEIVDLVLAFFLLLVLLFVAFCAHFEQAVDVERSLALFQVDELIL